MVSPPLAPTKKRTSARAKFARASRPTASTTALPRPDERASFPSSKRDKQKIKHSSFVSRIEKSSAKTQRRRRPNKKLVANLESLADALPHLGDEAAAKSGMEPGQASMVRPSQVMNSMKPTRGALKRKEKLQKVERERFNANLVQLASGTQAGAAVQDRWALLKSHVQSNMEVKPEFAHQ
ncbi:hypothetical protein BDW02DRAFT_600921 [Decorospora gaudefroyi]|uniref:Ribosome biogenesis protein SLX9 n=1 Tax=Decorospora gaudefroyi TaxID=184978 RepID=A0A6A5K119_9PLEO|nr:hypothetical protein BDW02DRAFT_600921 [Decorospora gaudefroyi]